MKRAVVTGAAGFIGKNLGAELESLGWVIYGVLENHLDLDEWEDKLQKEIDAFKPDAIFHVGACSNTLELRSQYIMERNFQSTKFLVDWCKNNSIPLIYSSSAANYGINGRYPSNLYGWSKYVAEAYVSSNEFVSLRYFNVYGPGEENKDNMASFYHQAFSMRSKGRVPKLFPGDPRRDFVYIKDVISANLAAFENSKICAGGIYDIGTSNPRSFEEGLEIIGIEYSYASNDAIPIGYQNYTCADLEKRLPGWTPKFQLEDGLSDYLEYLTGNQK